MARLTLLAAAQLCWASLASATGLGGNGVLPGGPNLLAAWSDLWRTPDQQGQALLDAGEPAQAAARFHDPRRRAYADLEAGRYQEAARLLEPFTDAESEYNRGNALAKIGQLQAALGAYDAALKQAPADKDIRHNRDLVERALRQQHQSPRSSAGNGRRGRQQGGSADQGQQSQQSAAGQQRGQGSPQSGGNSQQSGPRGSQSAGGQTAGDGQMASNGSGNPSGTDSGAPQSMAGYDAGTAKEKTAQAQRDAAAAVTLARQQQQRAGQAQAGRIPGPTRTPESAAKSAGREPDRQRLLSGGTQTPRQKPESERQLALDQWLRQIPDSPAGLLQRKFLIEHMLRQRESGDQEGSGP